MGNGQSENTTLWQSHENYISEFKPCQSTEHVLLKLINDPFILGLILLDLRATFDTMNYKILIECFELMAGLWGCNRLVIHRTFAVNVSNTSFQLDAILVFGVPQELVLGSVLISLHIQGMLNRQSIFYRLSGMGVCGTSKAEVA